MSRRAGRPAKPDRDVRNTEIVAIRVPRALKRRMQHLVIDLPEYSSVAEYVTALIDKDLKRRRR